MIKKQVFLFALMIAIISLACGLDLGLSDMDVPFVTTKTNTPSPSRTPTITPTYPPKLETSNDLYQIEVQEDTTTLFVDETLGYQVEFAPEWLVLPADENLREELYTFTAEELSENMQSVLNSSLEQAGIRMLALDYIEEYSQVGNTITNVSVVYQEDLASANYDLDILVEGNASVLPTQIPNAIVSYTAVQINPNGIKYGKMVINHPASTFGIPLRQIMMMVKAGEGVVLITCSVQDDLYSSAEPAFQKIFDSFDWVD